MKLCVAVLLLVAVVVAERFHNCGDEKDVFQVEDVSYAIRDGSVNIAVQALSRGHLNSGSYDVQVSNRLSQSVIQAHGDLCDIVPCPVRESRFNMTKTIALPNTLMGTYTLQVTAQSDNTPLFCTQFPVVIDPPRDTNCTVAAALACAAQIDTCWNDCKTSIDSCIQCLGPMWGQCCPCLNAMGIKVTC